MLTKINGSQYLELLSSGVENVDRHTKELNDLNVFPVPDGDTGTNMAMTMKQGLAAASESERELPEIAAGFSTAAVFGARGNSGVIVSQFFKGISEGLCGLDEADAETIHRALACGVRRAYAAVAKPVEGTMLTVLREATDALGKALPLESVDEAVEIFLASARESLSRTPTLLPILKKAGVVDSGAAGIVYFFDGVSRHLRGEELEERESGTPEPVRINLAAFNRDTKFEYGYCVEGLLQITREPCDFDFAEFREKLESRGESVVASSEGDKLKIHIHTKKLGRVMDLCQDFGEFLTLKIENMTVQNIERRMEEEREEKYLYDPEREIGEFATVAVATSSRMQRMLFDMGADVVILSEVAPSSQEFMEAFALTSAENIVVFPNSSNSILSSMQASSLYKKARVRVLNSRTTQECYAALSVLDFDADADSAVAQFNSVISGLTEAFLYHAVKDATFGRAHINKNEFFSISDGRILAVDVSLEKVAQRTADKLLAKREASVLTLFYGKDIAEGFVESIATRLGESAPGLEIASVASDETAYSIAMIFE